MELASEQEIKEIIADGNTEKLVNIAKKLGDRWGKELKANKDERLTRSQIRNVFNSVKKIELYGCEKKKDEFLLLQPKLAYAASRPGRTKGIEELRDQLTMAIGCVQNDPKRFENFCNFFEAILAYHRAAGGK